MEPVRVYFGLGSNLGDRLANLEWGLQILGERVRLVKVSSIYETEPWGVVEQPAFLNCVVEGFSTVSPGGVVADYQGDGADGGTGGQLSPGGRGSSTRTCYSTATGLWTCPI